MIERQKTERSLPIGLVGFFLSILLVRTTSAAEPEVLAEIEVLKKRLNELEAKVEAPDTNSRALDSSLPEKAPEPTKSVLDDLKISGMLNSIYSYNFNHPSPRKNVARVFDRESNSFTLNAAELVVQKPVSAESLIGFRTDLYFGDDAEVIHSAGLGDSSDTFDLQQAFVEVNVPTSQVLANLNDLNLKIGKFVSLAGAEVVESKDNWNTSRGLLYGYAEPFAHTGARLTYVFDNGWDIALGVNNGWDVADDNNNAKTIESHFGFNTIQLPGDSNLTIALQGYFGPEAADNDGAWRNLGDLVVIYQTPWAPLKMMYNFDYASEENVSTVGRSAKWYGHAGYAKLELADAWSIAFRGEYFNDKDGVRLVSGTAARYTEYTGTLEYRPLTGLITRLEFRYDDSSALVFNDNGSSLSDTQSTISGEIIYSF